MEILLIPDKFKDSLSAIDVINAIKEGINRCSNEFITHSIIASDGGDGFLDAVYFNNPLLETVKLESVDALQRAITSKYLFDPKKSIAYIELANTCGLAMLENEDRNPTMTTTIGCGMQIKHAIKKKATKIYIGLGGSATNDAGIGIAYALGFRFFDKCDNEIEPIGKNLIHINKIINTDYNHLNEVDIFAVNDVDNPLFGNSGATMVYGKQKGASFSELEFLEKGMQNFDKTVREEMDLELSNICGTGAAGGTGYGLKVFLNANFIPGVEFMLNINDVYSLLKRRDIAFIITGEGSIDDQTVNGKLVMGVTQTANLLNIPVVAICGKLDISSSNRGKLLVKDIIEIADNTKPLDYNLKNAYHLISDRIYNYFSNSNALK